MLEPQQILDVLRAVRDPHLGNDIVSLDMVSGVQVSKTGDVVFMIEVDPARGSMMEPLRQKAEQVVAAAANGRKVTAILTAERKAGAQPSNTSSISMSGHDPHGMNKNPKLELPIKKIIAVSSGKGGVGKSTVAAGVAKFLSKNSQLRIGLLDADIYGPSQPKLMGLEGCKPEFTKDKKIIPPVVDVEGSLHGLKVMSIGFMVDAEKALVWRGPMVQSALYQLFRDVQWDDEEAYLDVLIVDMPPGTGDAQLTLAQKVDVDGAIIVSTPQDLALLDARKGVEMFRAVDVPIIGLIENMSTYICSNCGHEEHIFGYGGAREEAERLSVPFLGGIPLSMNIRVQADAGKSYAFSDELGEAIAHSIDL